jgi:hypothetical protein
MCIRPVCHPSDERTTTFLLDEDDDGEEDESDEVPLLDSYSGLKGYLLEYDEE